MNKMCEEHEAYMTSIAPENMDTEVSIHEYESDIEQTHIDCGDMGDVATEPIAQAAHGIAESAISDNQMDRYLKLMEDVIKIQANQQAQFTSLAASFTSLANLMSQYMQTEKAGSANSDSQDMEGKINADTAHTDESIDGFNISIKEAH